MDDYPQRLPDARPPLEIQAAAAKWQQRLDVASGSEISHVADKAIKAMNKALGVDDPAAENVLTYFWGAGYVIEANGPDAVILQDDGTVHCGVSRGAEVLEIAAHNVQDIDLRLVHAIDMIAPLSIQSWAGHEFIKMAAMPITNSNFCHLPSLAGSNTDRSRSIVNHWELVDALGQEYAHMRRERSYRLSHTQREIAMEAERIKLNIEALIGNPGQYLRLRSDIAYVSDRNANGVWSLHPESVLRDKPIEVGYLGVGDFTDLQQSGIAISYTHFMYRSHDGLFLAVTMSEAANDKAGLSGQALLVPLAGNNFDYSPI